MHNESRAVRDTSYTRRNDFILGEDGVRMFDGDRVYNYYDMWPGTLRIDQADRDALIARPTLSAEFRNRGVWCKVEREGGGGIALLNGERICSIEFAKDNGWPGA